MQSPESKVNHLDEAKKYFKKASHLAYVTLSVLKENRLMIQIVSDLHLSVVNLIKAFLDYEASKKRIQLTRQPLENLNIFIQRVAPKYLSKEEINNLLCILEIAKKHKDSSLEFFRKEKFVIFANGKYEVLSPESIKRMSVLLEKSIEAFPNSEE